MEYEGSMVACEPKKILDYFFASEIRWACESGDLGRLKLGTDRPARRGRMCVWQYVCNARMYVEISVSSNIIGGGAAVPAPKPRWFLECLQILKHPLLKHH